MHNCTLYLSMSGAMYVNARDIGNIEVPVVALLTHTPVFCFFWHWLQKMPIYHQKFPQQESLFSISMGVTY